MLWVGTDKEPAAAEEHTTCMGRYLFVWTLYVHTTYFVRTYNGTSEYVRGKSGEYEPKAPTGIIFSSFAANPDMTAPPKVASSTNATLRNT